MTQKLLCQKYVEPLLLFVIGGTRRNCYHLLVQVSTATIKTRCWLLDHDDIWVTYLLCALYFCAVFVLLIITGIFDYNFMLCRSLKL